MTAAITTLTQRAAAFVAALAFALTALPAPAQVFETEAGAAYVVDHGTGQVLLAHNADVPLPPASMSKLMTLLMTFEALQQGRLTLETRLPVSAHAMSFGGSTMFLNTSDRPTVEELIRGVVVVSGNDASVVLAEALSPDGTEEGFGRIATERARELGMMQTTIRNGSGWPAPGHVMSMRDLGILAERIITEFPEYYAYFAGRIRLRRTRRPPTGCNRNPLLSMGIGADGLKTGPHLEAGYGLWAPPRRQPGSTFVIYPGKKTSQRRGAGARIRADRELSGCASSSSVSWSPARTELAGAPVFMGAATTVGLARARI